MTAPHRMSEAELLAEVIKLCEQLGLLYHHCPDGRGCQGQRGLPDLIVLGIRGLALIELKSADGELSGDQQRWWWTAGDLIDAMGAPNRGTIDGWLSYALWRPGDLASGLIERELSCLTARGTWS